MLRSGLCRDILIIADDYYLRLGLESFIKAERRTKSSLDSVTALDFISRTKSTDLFKNRLVIVSVREPSLFSAVMGKLKGLYWRVIFIFDVLPCMLASGEWGYTSKRNSFRSLRELIESTETERQYFNRKYKHRLLGEAVVRLLCGGAGISSIARVMGVNEKDVYREKRRMTKNYGLEHLNAIGILLCRDLLNVSKNKFK